MTKNVNLIARSINQPFPSREKERETPPLLLRETPDKGSEAARRKCPL
jgi:hypothetical protein